MIRIRVLRGIFLNQVIDIFENIIKNVLISLYQGFGASVLMAVLFMFAYTYGKERGWKQVVKHWWNNFKDKSEFRRVFLLAIYTFMLLTRTVLYRTVWSLPLGKVMGIWGLHDKNGALYTENIENIILFIPFMVLLLWAFHRKFFKNVKVKFLNSIEKSFVVSLSFSLLIEFTQLFFKLGTFQLSDLVFNTLGGIIGGIIYYCIYRFKERKDRKMLK